MAGFIIRNAGIINEGTKVYADVLIKGDRIEKIHPQIEVEFACKEIDAEGYWLFPGLMDDQVHFREPGLTHKGNIRSESRAAVAGGITSFMEMPNTKPPATTLSLLEDKYRIASTSSLANYSFFMGTSLDNYEEIMQVNPKEVCGLKIFMGASTGNMLVDDEAVLRRLFANVPFLIATHCEDESTIRNNLRIAMERYGEEIPVSEHPIIRNHEACYKSSSFAIELAKQYGTRLHVLHISTADECLLFESNADITQKKITAEACVHHLWFTDADYANKGNAIKWNPAVKKESDREAIRKALIENRIDILATDHAPHTLIEKSNKAYTQVPSGGPLVQHALNALIMLHHQGVFELETIVQKYCHNPALLFQIKERGFIREGYMADVVLFNPEPEWQVNKENVIYACEWSPFMHETFKGKVAHTWVNGHHVFENGVVNDSVLGRRLQFNR